MFGELEIYPEGQKFPNPTVGKNWLQVTGTQFWLAWLYSILGMRSRKEDSKEPSEEKESNSWL